MSFAAVAIGAGILGVTGITTAMIISGAQSDAAAAATAAANTAAETAAAASEEAARLQTEGAIEAARIAGEAATEAARIAADASAAASAEQIRYGQLGIEEQQRQFAAMQEIMKPWVDQGTEAMGQLSQYEAAGTDALARQRALMGLDGQDAQRSAMEQISNSPEMVGLMQQGENAMMQQGAATGGLRGGNTQAALAQFRPNMLSSLINQQYSKLGGLIDMGQGITMNRAALGQASAAGVGAAGMQTGSNIANLLMQQGNAAGQGIYGAGQAQAGGITGYGNAMAGGQMTAAQAAAAGVLGAGQARAQGQYQVGNIEANRILGAGQAWSQVPQQIAQGAFMGYGIQNPGAF
jgi:hypothetical protein